MKPIKLITRIAPTVAFCALSLTAWGQAGTWQFKAHMLFPRESDAAATAPNGHIYAFGGENNTGDIYSSAEAYDPTANSWTAISEMPDARRCLAAVTAPDGDIYLIGGLDQSDSKIATAYKYDPVADTYTPIANPPDALGRARAAIANDGRIYVFAEDLTKIYAYDINADSWSIPVVQPSTVPFDCAVCNASNGLVYRFAGAEGPVINTADSLNAVTDVWTALPTLPIALDGAYAAQGGDGKIYVAGGDGSGGLLTSVETYDPVANAWGSAPDLLEGADLGATAEGLDGKVYVIGGVGSIANGPTDHVECFQPALLSGAATTISVVEGTAFSGAVANIQDVDGSQTSLDFTATIDWGDGSAPVAASVSTGVSSGTYVVTANHTYAEEGTFNTKITVNDSDGESLTLTGKANVADAPLTVTAVNFSATTNAAFSGKVGSFTDANPNGPIGDFSAVINWGDSSAFWVGTVTVNASGGFVVTASHTYTAVGSYTTSIDIFDAGGFEQKAYGTATVTAPAPIVTTAVLHSVESAEFTGTVASFTDSDPTLTADKFSASINWGDGTTNSGSVASSGTGFTVAGTHVYAEEGVYAITVTVTVQGSSGSNAGTMYVADAPLTATGFNLTCKGTIFSNTVATFTDANPHAVASEFSAAIFWGDGKSSTGTVVAAGSGFKVVGTHSYLKRGKYVATVTIKDVGGSTASATTNINVGPVK